MIYITVTKEKKVSYSDLVKKIYEIGILPVIAIDDPESAVPLARALCEGGLPAAEITFRTPCAKEAIIRIKRELPDMLVGAGTVLTQDQADDAVSAGAEFIVTPGFNPETVKYVLSRGVPIMPGTATPGEMEQAMSMGLEIVKFFPAEQNGGLSKLKAVSAPYQKLRFIPTGGINSQNLSDYIKFPKVLACGGTWMVKKELIEAKNWDEIRRLTTEAVRSMLGLEFAHLGINCDCGADSLSKKGSGLLGEMFGFDWDEDFPIFTAQRKIELCKAPARGTLGHIGIYTNSVGRAAAYFRKKGYNIPEFEIPCKGPVYFEDEFMGFAVHLTQK